MPLQIKRLVSFSEGLTLRFSKLIGGKVCPLFLCPLRDPRQRRGQNWQCFAQRFGLTPAELRLCMALTEDLCLAEYSEQFRISPHTARSQLKSIFEKTGAHRQVQLLRLIFAFVQP